MIVWMIRLTGIALIVGGSTAMGFSYAKDRRQRVEEWIELRKLMVLLRGEIQYHQATLEEAFMVIAKRGKEPWASFFSSFAKKVETIPGIPLFVLFEETRQEIFGENHSLQKEQLNQMGDLIRHIGYLDRGTNVTHIDLYLEQLSTYIVEEEKNYKKNAPLYRCLGIMGGLVLSLILV